MYSREGGEMLSNISSVESVAPFQRRSCLPHFAECLLRCHASLYRNARSLRHASCGEPLRETYSRASAAKRGPSANADEVRSWMFTILRNVWLNGRRRIWRSRESSFRGRRRCRFHRMRPAAFLPFGRIHLHPAPDKTWVHFHAAFGQKFGNVFVGRGDGVL